MTTTTLLSCNPILCQSYPAIPASGGGSMVSKIKIRFAGDFGEGLEFVEVEDAATGESIDIGEWDHGSGGSTLILSPSDIEDASACPMSGGSDGV